MLSILYEALSKSNSSLWNDWKNTQVNDITIKDAKFLRSKFITASEFDFWGVTFNNCIFNDVQFVRCIFEHCKFSNCEIFGHKTSFRMSNFTNSEFRKCTLKNASFLKAILSDCKFINTKMEDLNFFGASLINSYFEKGSIQDCRIFGANIWSITTKKTLQKDMRIIDESTGSDGVSNQITIDDIELGNIVYLLAANSNFSKFIDQSKSNFVLILGRFGDYLPRLEAIKQKLREERFSPIVFDFTAPTSLDLIESIMLLSLLSKFIIVDLTEPKSVPAELQSILTSIMIPVAPILDAQSKVYGTYSFTNRYKWVLPVLIYNSVPELISVLKPAIIDPANRLFREILKIKTKTPGTRSASDFL